MNAGEVCSREVYIMRPEEPLSGAVALMHGHEVGAVIVVQQEGNLLHPIGIVTDRDVVYAQVSRGAALPGLRIEDAMTSHPTLVAEDASLTEAIRRMSDAGVRRAPVVDETGDLVGIVTLDDLLPVLAEELQGLAGLIGGQAGAAQRDRSAQRVSGSPEASNARGG
jgi:CBS domain-containing protein